ncbi:MAG: hypothetical protein JSR56_07670 [Proteobacteria bacterium]|nr:hypothetical protein [Pseudomonadota bacterium]
MTDAELDALRASVDAALAPGSDADTDAVWNALNEAIDAMPDDARLRRLRIRMARASYEHHLEHADLLALLRLAPEDRDSAMDLALLQYRYASMLVDIQASDFDGASAGDGQSEAAQKALQQQALTWLADMLDQYHGDADFCAQILERWKRSDIYVPWLRLRLALQAAAAYPDNARLLLVLASAWDDLCDQAPDNYVAGESKIPPGFLVDAIGMLRDPFMSARAIACYTALLQVQPDHAVALNARARLHESLYDYEEAARDYDAAAQAFERIAASVTPEEKSLVERGGLDDTDLAAALVLERVSAASFALAARDQAALCRGGRAAHQASILTTMEDALGKLREPMRRPSGNRPEMQELMADMERRRKQTLGELEAQLAEIRQTTLPAQPDANRLAEFRTTARQVAAKIIKAMPTELPQILPLAPEQFEGDWLPHFEDFRATLRALGWHELGWVEWPHYRAMLGYQCVSQIWADVDGSMAMCFRAFGRLHIDVETELQDGRQFITSVSRGSNFLTYGDALDTLFVERSLPLQDICALHRAHVAWASATTNPPSAPRPVRTLQDVIDMQQRAAPLKVRYRLEQGLNHYEACGMHSDYPEVFGPLVQAAVREQLDERRPQFLALLSSQA